MYSVCRVFLAGPSTIISWSGTWVSVVLGAPLQRETTSLLWLKKAQPPNKHMPAIYPSYSMSHHNKSWTKQTKKSSDRSHWKKAIFFNQASNKPKHIRFVGTVCLIIHIQLTCISAQRWQLWSRKCTHMPVNHCEYYFLCPPKSISNFLSSCGE